MSLQHKIEEYFNKKYALDDLAIALAIIIALVIIIAQFLVQLERHLPLLSWLGEACHFAASSKHETTR